MPNLLFDTFIDLLNPPAELEKRRHKVKRLVQSPNSFMIVPSPQQRRYYVEKTVIEKDFGHIRLVTTPLLAGLAVAAAALAGRYSIQAWHAYKARPVVPRMRKFYEGGFQGIMTRREASLILGVRETAPPDKVKEAHRKVMVANHPDAGGSHYLASKINEAKDVLLGKTKGGGSAF
ncbi:DnaJ domain [Musa troglodytarum]|uniref:DnaJ domain n=1 Tax=Musa troglodytarum TaxID=320322 RepID=A0A9E7EJ84_9LILI|nr:DnaJ domain [Musa troglodytarum]